jgi:hypothetical protein
MKPKRVPAPSTPGILDDDPTPMRRMTAEERLRFVVRFEQMDLDTLRPGDWLNLLDDFLAFFLAVSSPHRVMPHVWLEGVPSGNPSDELWSRQDFRALQQDVRTLLRSFAGAPDAQGAFVALHGEVAYAGGMRVVRARPHDLFLWEMDYLLAGEQSFLAHIRACPECGTIFYRVKAQAYCSRTCGNRATQRRWRERRDSAAATG